MKNISQRIRFLVLAYFLLTLLQSSAFGATQINQTSAGAQQANEAATAQTMNQKLQRYNEMSRRVHDRQFRGANDEDQLKVMTAVPKPERGAIGSQLQAKDNADREHGEESQGQNTNGEDPSQEQQHD